MGLWLQKRVQSSAAEQTGSKLHRWSRASAGAKAAKNKLGMLLHVLQYSTVCIVFCALTVSRL